MPRDPWLQNRANMQPGEEFFERSFGAFALQAEITAGAETMKDLFVRLEAAGQLLRLDASVTPTMYHGAIVSMAELEALQRITNVVRMGRIQRIERSHILLERGVVESSADLLYVDCSARGVERRPAIPMSDTPQDWLSIMLMNLANQDRWRHDPQVRDWITHSRLDRFSGLARKVTPAEIDKVALLQRYGHAAAAAAPNLQRLIAHAVEGP